MNKNECELLKFQKKMRPDLTLAQIRNLKNQVINVYQDFDSDEDIEMLAALPNLESLIFHGFQPILTEKALRILAKSSSLKELRMKGLEFNEKILKGVAAIPTLESFSTDEWINNPHFLDVFAGNTHLKKLSLSVDWGFLAENIPSIPSLEILKVEMNSGFKPEYGFKIAEKIPNLKAIWDCSTEYRFENGQFVEQESFDYQHIDSEDVQVPAQVKSLILTSSFPGKVWEQELPRLESLAISSAPNLEKIDFSRMPNLQRFTMLRRGESLPVIELMNLDSLENLESIMLGTKQLDPNFWRSVEMLSSLHFLSVPACCALRGEDVSCVSALKNLEFLGMNLDESLTPEEFGQIEELPHLDSLHLGGGNYYGMMEGIFSKFPLLHSLNLCDYPIQGEEIEQLAACKRLVKLTLGNCSELTPYGLEQIFSMSNVHEFTLDFCLLEELELKNYENARLLKLQNWNELKEASISEMPELYSCTLISPSLETLTIKNAPKLRELNLYYCKSLNFLRLENLPNLAHLNLRESPNLDLLGLIGLQKLESLSLTFDQIRQEMVLETLQELPNLKLLYLEEDDEKVERTEDGCKHYKGLPPEEKEKIKKALPNCEIRDM